MIILGGFVLLVRDAVYIAPILFVTAMDLAMRGQPAPSSEAIPKLAIAYTVTALTFFIPGALAGAILGRTKWRRHTLWIVAALSVIFCIVAKIGIFKLLYG